MTSRERVKAVINHKIPDRVPIDIGGSCLTGISVDAYIELAEYAGIDCAFPKVCDTYQMLARVEGSMRDYLHTDVVCVENPIGMWGYQQKGWKPWQTQKGNNVLVPGEFNVTVQANGKIQLFDAKGGLAGEMPQGGLYFDKVFPGISGDLAGEIEFMDVNKFKQSIPLYSDDELRIIEKSAKFYKEHTDYSVCGEFLKGNLGTAGVFGIHPFTQWMCIAMIEPEYALSLVTAYAERAIENFDLYKQAVGDCIDTIFVSSTDFGTQNGEFYSPDTFHEIYYPNYKMINDHIHKNSEYKIIFHCCGSILKILPDFVDAGVDILNPVQTSAEGMNPQYLKDNYGDKLVFWGGGIDTQDVYPNGSVADVERQVKERISVFGKDGGFVFSPIHNTQYGVPPQNIEAMVKTVLSSGKY